MLNGNVTATLPDTVDLLDLSKPFSNADTSIWSYVSKNGTNSSNTPPIMNDGGIFATKSSLFLFGGALSNYTGAPVVPPPNGICEYTSQLSNGQWAQAKFGGDPVQRIHLGSSAQSATSSLGYYLGGAITSRSDPSFNALPGATPYMVQGLVTLNEKSMDLQNASTNGLNKDGTAAAGFLALIETLGSAGVLVSFGGLANVPGKAMNLYDADLVDPSLHWGLAHISVYDIGSGTWYQQSSTGDIPSWRYLGCSIVVSAPDQSSHSIYVFGGWGNTAGGSDGNVYVLSIPSFRWIRVNIDSDLRARHHCGLIGNHTMLVVGGIKPNGEILQPNDTSGCDTSPMFAQGLGIFSLNNHTWATNYVPSEGSLNYQVHESITKVIGGDTNGSASVQTPLGGFGQPALGNILGPHPLPNNSNPVSSSSPSPRLGKATIGNGTIAGIVLAVAALAMVSALCFILLRRRYRRNPRPRPKISAPMAQASELHAVTAPQELNNERVLSRELSGMEKALPPRPLDEKVSELHEMEARLGMHPAERDRKDRVADHRYT